MASSHTKQGPGGHENRAPEPLTSAGNARPLYDGHVPWPGVLFQLQGLTHRTRLEEWSAEANVAKGSMTPEQSVRAVAERMLGADGPLPPTRALELYYLVGVENGRVLYGPFFIYLLDVGFPALIGVSLTFNANGRGDPAFPNFGMQSLSSVLGRDANELIYSNEPATLLVGFDPTVPDATAITELQPFGRDIVRIAPALFTLRVKAFHETDVAATIRTRVPQVRNVELNHLMRFADFGPPGWVVTRVV